MPFKYNIDDTRKIPGLQRPWERGTPFLTPVFFDIEILVRYFYDPRYECEFYGETYGKIDCPEDPNYEYDSSFPFGINPNRKVIAWLGDINKLDPKEQLYLESHNIESDGNIRSEFYDGQIGTEFADPIREVELVLFKRKLNKLTHELYNFHVYKTTKENVSDIVSLCSKFKRIIFNSEDDIKRFLSAWNEDLIEDLNVVEIKNTLMQRGIQIDSGVKGVKLFEKFLKEVVGIRANIIAPLFYLYDLRLWADHREMQKTYDNIIEKMKLSPTSPFSEVYSCLIQRIYDFFSALNKILLENVPKE